MRMKEMIERGRRSKEKKECNTEKCQEKKEE